MEMAPIEFAWAGVDVAAESGEHLFRRIMDAMHRSGRVPEVEEPVRRLLEREAVQSTAVGRGIALPHARSEALRDHVVAAARVSVPLEFGAPDGEPVDLFFVVLGPEDAPGDHVQVLARLARGLDRPGFLQELRSAPDDEAFRDVLRRGVN